MSVLRHILADRWAALSFGIVTVTIFAGLFAPLLAPHDPQEVRMELRYAGATWEYWLGNDHLGRCVLSRLLYAIEPSVLWVFAALVLSVLLGAIPGFLAGYFRGKTDAVLMRICDVMLSFPGYVMTLAVIGIVGVGLGNILLAFILLKWAWFARIIRTSVMEVADTEYVRFSKAIGASHFRIIATHIVPVTLPVIAVLASSTFGSMILQISGFSFLGLGIQAPNAEWGMMLHEAREVMFSRPEMMLPPGLAIVIVVSAVNFLSDSLQAAMDPKVRASRMGSSVLSPSFAGKLQGREAS